MPSDKEKDTRAWVGVDLGGTKMMAVVFDAQMRPLGRDRRKCKPSDGAEMGLKRLEQTVREALAQAKLDAKDLAGIGVGAPGNLDLDKGAILESPNLGWRNVPLRKLLGQALDTPLVVVNDVDAGVFGEHTFGAARGSRCTVGAFPGTGIGGGCVYEGQLLRGATSSCMELGHLPMVVDGLPCGCGRRGCLETVASRLAIAGAAAAAAHRGEAPHLLAAVGTDLAEIKSSALAAAIAEGDTVVETIVRRAARQLGRALGGVVNLLAPDCVLLGGGLVEAMPELYRKEVGAAIAEHSMPAYKGTYRVEVAKLGDDAVAAGAAAWARQKLQT